MVEIGGIWPGMGKGHGQANWFGLLGKCLKGACDPFAGRGESHHSSGSLLASLSLSDIDSLVQMIWVIFA